VEDRWIAFGDQLRQLREAAGFSGKGLAEFVGWQPSKVSRIENAKQTITDSDVKTWCEATGVTGQDETALHGELRAIRLDEARWKSRLRRGHEELQQTVGRIELSANRIRVFETALVPGLIQTPDYARAIFSGLAAMRDTPRDTEEAVQARLQRQAVLYDSSKRIELLVAESALRNRVAPAEVMSGQIDRLLALPGMRTVRFGVLPSTAQLDVAPLHGFSIFDDLLTVEIVHTEITTRNPVDVDLYASLADSLWERAVEGYHARALLLRVLESFSAPIRPGK
jgi:transcriptional regulator with XRE-family HTH domain